MPLTFILHFLAVSFRTFYKFRYSIYNTIPNSHAFLYSFEAAIISLLKIPLLIIDFARIRSDSTYYIYKNSKRIY